jgi:hypothetical protein
MLLTDFLQEWERAMTGHLKSVAARYLALPMTILAALASRSSADAEPFLLAAWQIDKQTTLSGYAGPITIVDVLRIGFGPTSAKLFENVAVDTSDIGATFFADASNDPDFPTVAALLTNGSTLDNVNIATGSSQGALIGFNNRSEATWAGISRADFSGYQITSIGLHFDNVMFISPGRDLNHDGKWTDYGIQRELFIYGVPEPTAPILCAVAFTIAACRRRRRPARRCIIHHS